MIDPRAPLPEIERPRGMRERLAALRYLPQLVRLVWQTHRGFTAAMVVLRLVRAFVPVATLWAAKLIIDEVVLLTRTPGAPLDRPVARGRPRARDRRRRRAARARVGARGVAARRPVLEPHQRAAHAPRRHARSRAVRGSGLLRPSRARAPADDGAHRADRDAAHDGAGPASRSARSARRSSSTTRGSCSCSPLAILPSFLGETHFAALSYSLLFRRTPGAPRARLPALRRRQRQDGEGSADVRARRLARGPLRRARPALLRGEPPAQHPEGLVSALLSLVGTLGYYAAYVDDPAARRGGSDHARARSPSSPRRSPAAAISSSACCSRRATSTSRAST